MVVLEALRRNSAVSGAGDESPAELNPVWCGMHFPPFDLFLTLHIRELVTSSLLSTRWAAASVDVMSFNVATGLWTKKQKKTPKSPSGLQTCWLWHIIGFCSFRFIIRLERIISSSVFWRPNRKATRLSQRAICLWRHPSSSPFDQKPLEHFCRLYGGRNLPTQRDALLVISLRVRRDSRRH